jgi:hypothetical protein
MYCSRCDHRYHWYHAHKLVSPIRENKPVVSSLFAMAIATLIFGQAEENPERPRTLPAPSFG